MNKSNIVLIGMPGAGKSTLGVILAKTMKMPFIDTDILIQQREDRTLQDIINMDGIKEFLEVEKKAILEIRAEGHVIATGGSVVYSQAAMEHLKENGIIVYLKLEYEEIEQRVRNIKTRGIAMEKNQSLYHLFKERAPLYQRYADMTIDCSGKNDETLIDELKKKCEEVLNI